MIYRRFTEKSAEEWRQIYKSLQLLEYLIKHGSERVIDDARGHITLLKMLRQFHFIDQNGKDQGINVRNRAKELAELLADVDRIRAERKKARANKAKYTGVEGGTGGFSSGRFGGFGSESSGYGGPSGGYGGYSGGVYGDGGGFGGQSDDWRDSSRGGDKFEEYDEYDEGGSSSHATSSRRRERTERAGVKKTIGTKAPEKKKEPEVDLFSFDEPETSTPAAPVAAPVSANGNGSSAAMNRRQKRLQEKENKKNAKKGLSNDGVATEDISEPQEPTLISGPQGNKRRVVAENGKVLIVDSVGNVFLEETTEEGETTEYLIDVR